MPFWYSPSPASNIKLSVLFFLHKTVRVCQNQHDISAWSFDIFRFIMLRRYLKALHSFSLEGLMTTKGGKETLHAIQCSMQTLLAFEFTSNTEYQWMRAVVWKYCLEPGLDSRLSNQTFPIPPSPDDVWPQAHLPWRVSGTWFHTPQVSALRTSSHVVNIPAGCLLGRANLSWIPQPHKDTFPITPSPSSPDQPHTPRKMLPWHAGFEEDAQEANCSLCLPGHPCRICTTVGLQFVISGQVWGESTVAEFCNLRSCADISEL